MIGLRMSWLLIRLCCVSSLHMLLLEGASSSRWNALYRGPFALPRKNLCEVVLHASLSFFIFSHGVSSTYIGNPRCFIVLCLVFALMLERQSTYQHRGAALGIKDVNYAAKSEFTENLALTFGIILNGIWRLIFVPIMVSSWIKSSAVPNC